MKSRNGREPSSFRRFIGLLHLSCLSVRLVNEPTVTLESTIVTMRRCGLQWTHAIFKCRRSHFLEPFRLVAMKRIVIFAERRVIDTWIGPFKAHLRTRNY